MKPIRLRKLTLYTLRSVIEIAIVVAVFSAFVVAAFCWYCV